VISLLNSVGVATTPLSLLAVESQKEEGKNLA
jgi:hypothetical protein